jgi:hypothetical protein
MSQGMSRIINIKLELMGLLPKSPPQFQKEARLFHKTGLICIQCSGNHRRGMVDLISANGKEMLHIVGQQRPPDDPLFSYNVELETRVRQNHPLRRIKQAVDFTFIYNEVKSLYGSSGNVSVPPPGHS